MPQPRHRGEELARTIPFLFLHGGKHPEQKGETKS